MQSNETIMTNEACVAMLAEHVKVGKRRVVLVDPKDSWRLVVRLDLSVGSLRISSGNGDLDGWMDDTDPTEFAVDGMCKADAGYLTEFAEFVCKSYVGDERILDCVAHLIKCQS